MLLSAWPLAGAATLELAAPGDEREGDGCLPGPLHFVFQLSCSKTNSLSPLCVADSLNLLRFIPSGVVQIPLGRGAAAWGGGVIPDLLLVRDSMLGRCGI